MVLEGHIPTSALTLSEGLIIGVPSLTQQKLGYMNLIDGKKWLSFVNLICIPNIFSTPLVQRPISSPNFVRIGP